jgi:hypothetical protein
LRSSIVASAAQMKPDVVAGSRSKSYASFLLLASQAIDRSTTQLAVVDGGGRPELARATGRSSAATASSVPSPLPEAHDELPAGRVLTGSHAPPAAGAGDVEDGVGDPARVRLPGHSSARPLGHERGDDAPLGVAEVGRVGDGRRCLGHALSNLPVQAGMAEIGSREQDIRR